MNYTPNSKAAALVARLKEARENVSAILELWRELFGEPTPSVEQIHRWLIMYGFDLVVEAIEDLSRWAGKNQQALEIIKAERTPTPEEVKNHSKDLLDLVRYASGIMRNKKARPDEKPAA